MRNTGLISTLILSAMVFVLIVVNTGCGASFETSLTKSQQFGLCLPPVVAAASCLYEAAKGTPPPHPVP